MPPADAVVFEGARFWPPGDGSEIWILLVRDLFCNEGSGCKSCERSSGGGDYYGEVGRYLPFTPRRRPLESGGMYYGGKQAQIGLPIPSGLAGHYRKTPLNVRSGAWGMDV